MRHWKAGFAAAMIAGWVCSQAPAKAATPPQLTGSIVGFVGNATGVAQMGAAVQLFNRYDRLVQKALTNDRGAFGFDALAPDLYSIRVSLSSFLPALKQNILVQPGMRSFLSINLVSILSSIELVYVAPGQSSIMTDDWKWVLRSSLATRPVLRFRPFVDYSDPRAQRAAAANLFSDTRGMLRLSAGDAGTGADFGRAPDLGTAFAVATSVFGANRVQVSGNVGYAAMSGSPSAGFSTSFSRGEPGGLMPEVQLTMRQVFLPARAGAGVVNSRQSAPPLRTLALSLQDRTVLAEGLDLEYGFTLESVTFLDRLNYFSPHARLSYDLGAAGRVEAGYSSGVPPAASPAGGSADADLQRDLTRLSAFPRVSLEGGRVRVQRTENFELGYMKVVGSRTFRAGAYRESVAHAGLLIAAPGGLFAGSGDVLPDLFSNSSIFSIGRYRSLGYTGSVSQALGEAMSVSLAYGSGGVLRTDERRMRIDSPAELRSLVRTSRRQWLTARWSGTARWTGTNFVTSYLWTDYRALTPGHHYLTRQVSPETGWNVYLRQPIPAFGGMPGRLEASVDFRNLLAQGYLPLRTADGREVFLIHSPRAVRGGLSFIF
ncbi:MAG: carboxypeptidase regulatory-like domain-containing protein [Acidobacteria bacterium]|nr:carboxypeptidase regulatory-like domain-containing protein [Acidobacteriota bacterium]